MPDEVSCGLSGVESRLEGEQNIRVYNWEIRAMDLGNPTGHKLRQKQWRRAEEAKKQKTGVLSLDLKDALEKEMEPIQVFLPGKSHRQRSLATYSPWGRKRVIQDLANNQQQQQRKL